MTLSVTCIIYTLEKCESLRVKGCSGVESSTHILKGNMHMADDLSITANGLRRGVVFGGWVDEHTGGKTRDGDRDIEVLVGSNVDTGLRVRDDSRDHLILRRNITHRNAIAGPCDVLLTVGDGFTGAEVDEIEWIADTFVSRGNGTGNQKATYVLEAACPGLIPSVPASWPVRSLAFWILAGSRVADPAPPWPWPAFRFWVAFWARVRPVDMAMAEAKTALLKNMMPNV